MSDQRIEVNSGFYDSVNGDRLYSADQMNMPYKRIVADGVFATNYGDPSTDLQVISANDGMKIKVKNGEAIVGTKWFNNPETKTITVPANTSANPRIDSVFIQTDKSLAVRSGAIVYRTGEPDASPEPPSISEDPEIIEIRVANIAVAVNASTITNAEITDLRGSSECPWVTGLITQVDTSTLWAQFQSAYAQQYEQYNEDFENYIRAQRSAWATFIEGLTDDLTVATNIVALENKYTAQDTVLSIPVGIQNYNPQTDVLQVFINGILAFENDKYTINAAGTTITLANPIAAGNTVYFVVYKNLVTGNVDSIQNEIAGLQAAIGSPLVASTVAEMTDTSRVYVYVGNETGYTAGNWYYYNTSEWVSGGVYNSVAVQTDTSLTQSGMAADAKATGDRIRAKGVSDDIKQALLNCFSNVAWINGQGQNYYDILEDALYPDVRLESISAVYTQSGSVYITDSLDSLKEDLVVTALYDDTTTETVTTYTLSGTLSVGTSTITVSYGGKTTTFTATVSEKYYYDLTDGLELINAGTAPSASVSSPKTTGEIILLYTDMTTKRRSFPVKTEAPRCMKGSTVSSPTTEQLTDTIYYPIRIPTDATGVTVSLTPNTQYISVIAYTYDDINHYITNSAGQTGWAQGTGSLSFAAGTYQYLSLCSKYDSSGSSYPTDPSALTVTFTK